MLGAEEVLRWQAARCSRHVTEDPCTPIQSSDMYIVPGWTKALSGSYPDDLTVSE